MFRNLISINVFDSKRNKWNYIVIIRLWYLINLILVEKDGCYCFEYGKKECIKGEMFELCKVVFNLLNLLFVVFLFLVIVGSIFFV